MNTISKTPLRLKEQLNKLSGNLVLFNFVASKTPGICVAV
jgi:hypothetical protein